VITTGETSCLLTSTLIGWRLVRMGDTSPSNTATTGDLNFAGLLTVRSRSLKWTNSAPTSGGGARWETPTQRKQDRFTGSA